MRSQYPAHLYIRIDRPLRADLHDAAEAAGLNVSVFARRVLRAALHSAGWGTRTAARPVPSSTK